MASSEQQADQYGQTHPNETADLVVEKLKELETELTKIAPKDRSGYDEAKTKCPQLLTAEFKLLFLRCEVFNTDLAAIRLCKYWKKRIELFGPDKAFLPLTQKGALKDDSVALLLGFAKLIPGIKDPSGRALVFIDPSVQDKTKYKRESMARALFYTIQSILQDDVDAQKKGIVFVACPRGTKFAQFDRALAKLNMESIKGCLPIRMSAIHICHPTQFFAIIWPLFKLFLGERLRKRVHVHSGSDEHVLERLQTFGLTKDHVPEYLMGGTVQLDHEGWVKAQSEKENN